MASSPAPAAAPPLLFRPLPAKLLSSASTYSPSRYAVPPLASLSPPPGSTMAVSFLLQAGSGFAPGLAHRSVAFVVSPLTYPPQLLAAGRVHARVSDPHGPATYALDRALRAPIASSVSFATFVPSGPTNSSTVNDCPPPVRPPHSCHCHNYDPRGTSLAACSLPPHHLPRPVKSGGCGLRGPRGNGSPPWLEAPAVTACDSLAAPSSPIPLLANTGGSPVPRSLRPCGFRWWSLRCTTPLAPGAIIATASSTSPPPPGAPPLFIVVLLSSPARCWTVLLSVPGAMRERERVPAVVEGRLRFGDLEDQSSLPL